MTSGKLDFGMLAVVDNYISKSCKAIVDVTIGEYGKVYSRKEIELKKINPVNDLDFYLCPDCGSDENLVKWNKRTRPCPCCDGKMYKDRYGAFCL